LKGVARITIYNDVFALPFLQTAESAVFSRSAAKCIIINGYSPDMFQNKFDQSNQKYIYRVKGAGVERTTIYKWLFAGYVSK